MFHDCALLQPITSLISSFTFVKPECAVALYSLQCTSLADNKLVQPDGDPPCSSQQLSIDDEPFPIQADFCVNLDRLFSHAPSGCNSQSL